MTEGEEKPLVPKKRVTVGLGISLLRRRSSIEKEDILRQREHIRMLIVEEGKAND